MLPRQGGTLPRDSSQQPADDRRRRILREPLAPRRPLQERRGRPLHAADVGQEEFREQRGLSRRRLQGFSRRGMGDRRERHRRQGEDRKGGIWRCHVGHVPG